MEGFQGYIKKWTMQGDEEHRGHAAALVQERRRNKNEYEIFFLQKDALKRQKN